MKPLAVYFSILQFKHQILNFCRELIRSALLSRRNMDEETLGRANLIFAPLGYLFDHTFFSKTPSLKVIASNTTGIPHINLEAAKEHGVEVVALHDDSDFLSRITPTVEHTVGLIVAASRNFLLPHRSAVKGQWDRRPWGVPKMLSRSTIEIVGYGRIGKKVALICEAMGMTVRWYDPYVSDDGDSFDDLQEMVKGCDVLSLHAVANEETTNLISEKILSNLPSGSVVINTARGELLDVTAFNGNILRVVISALQHTRYPRR